MDYSQAIAYIESLSPVTIRSLTETANAEIRAAGNHNTPSLDRIALFMKQNGDVQNSYPVIHIGGTNGKGSVTATVASVLSACGLKTGRYIGPHLLRWNERYHIGSTPIADEELAKLAERVKTLSEKFGAENETLGSLTWFEFLTAMGFIYFADQKVDCAAIEVGLGGRWDATNAVAKPIVSCIVTVGRDHMHILGSTVGKIAAEKAGIIKPRTPVVTAAKGAALRVISAKAQEHEAPLVVCSFDSKYRGAIREFSLKLNKFAKQAGLESLEDLVTTKGATLLDDSYQGGKFQKQNALVACTVLGICEINQSIPGVNPLDHLAEGIEAVYWPGRFQYIPGKAVLLDGAHNEPAAIALRKSLDERFLGKRSFVLAAYQNKDVNDMLKHLLRAGDSVYAADIKGKRASYPAADIVRLSRQLDCKAQAFSSIREAFRAALSKKAKKETVICTGSFVTVKECLKELGCRSVEDAMNMG